MPVFFRSTGTVAGPSFVVRRNGGVEVLRLPLTCAVVERPDGVTLIDTGWSRFQCAWPREDPGLALSLALGMKVAPEDALASQLISCGLHADDVKHIVATHLHLDHISGAADFPKATVHTTDDEWNARSLGRLRGYLPSLRSLEPRVERHALRGPAMLGFPASHDLFGDGAVQLLDARGHTPGSLAVAVRLEDSSWALHCGDAVFFVDEFADGASTGLSPYARTMAWDITRLRQGLASLQEAERDHKAKVIPSHDPAVFEKLPKTREDGWKGLWDRKAPKAQNKPQKPKEPRPPREPREPRQGDARKPPNES